MQGPTPPSSGRKALPAAPSLATTPFSSPIDINITENNRDTQIAAWYGVGQLNTLALKVGLPGLDTDLPWYVGFALRVSAPGQPMVGNMLPPIYLPSGSGFDVGLVSQNYWYPGPEISALAGSASPGTPPTASKSQTISTYYLTGAWSADASGNVIITFVFTQTFPYVGTLGLYAWEALSTPATLRIKGRATGTNLSLASL